MFTSKTGLSLKPQRAGTQYDDELPPRTYVAVPEDVKSTPTTSAKKYKKMFPRDDPPKSLMLPYVRVSDEVADKRNRYIETDSYTRGNIMRMVRQRKGQSITPGWLVELGDTRLNAIMDIEQVLKAIEDPCHLVAALHTIIKEKLLLNITRDEITDVINKVMDTPQGLTFSRFMFALGNPKYATKCGILKSTNKTLDCSQLSDDGPSEEAGTGDVRDNSKNNQDKDKTKSGCKGSRTKSSNSSSREDETGYSEREKVFYSGLLVLQMYDTLQGVEELYFQNYIPEPLRTMPKRGKLGFGIESIGIRKLGFAEWDRPPAPYPKLSPYISVVPFVTSRWKVFKPNADEKGRRRTLNELYPMHLVVEPPISDHYGIQFHDPIRITENRLRIKKALEYLASTGDCVALLPNIHFVIHLSDTFVDKLEEISMKPSRSKFQKIYVGNEIITIAREARALYRPHGIPKQVSQLKSLIKYTEALHLRKLTNHIKAQHWVYINNLKTAFRQRCWEKMHVKLMCNGKAKQSFVDTFVTYLPYKSDLPVHHHHNPNPS